MAKKTELELSLRIKADANAAKKALESVEVAIKDVTTATATAEKTNQQAASTEKTNVQAKQESAKATRKSTEETQKNSAAQQASMQAATAARNATVAQTQAAERAAQAAGKVAAEIKKEDMSLQQAINSIDKTERALDRLDKAEERLTAEFKRGGLAADDYAKHMANIHAQRNGLLDIPDDAKKATTSINTLSNSAKTLRNVLLSGVAGVGIVSLTREIVQTNLAWQQAMFTMKAATGDAKEAGIELDYVKEVSNRLGLELISTSQAYARLVAASKETPDLAPFLHDIFEGVSMAGTALHLVPSEMQSILLAMEQMVSKGKVQTQELVLQLGQRIPGAFGLAANALGTNTAQLSKWLEQGVIPAKEFLPRFAEALKEAYGPASQEAAGGLQAQLNRLTNSWTELKLQAGDAGFIDSFSKATEELTQTLKDPAIADGLNTLISGLGKIIELSVKAAGGVGNFAGATKFIAESAAAGKNGPALDDIPRLEDEVTRLEDKLSGLQRRYFEAVDRGWDFQINQLEMTMTAVQGQIGIYQAAIDQFNGVSLEKLGKPTGGGSTPPNNGTPVLDPFAPDTSEADAKAKKKESEKAAKDAEARRKKAHDDYIAQFKRDAEQQADDLKTLDQLQIDYWRSTGEEAKATAAEIEQTYGAIKKRLTDQGDSESLALIDNVINLKNAEADLDALQTKFQSILDEQQRKEQSINVQQEAGSLGELAARDQIVELHKQTSEELLKQRPMLEALAKQPGLVGIEATAALKTMDVEAMRLQATLNVLQSTLQQGLTNGLTNALEGLIQGTMNMREAAVALAQSVAQALISMAAQRAAQGIVSSLFSSPESPAPVQKAIGGLVTGPGTQTSDSIAAKLSNNEFVTRAAVVTQPDALEFLKDFNRRGMVSLRDWAPPAPVNHANGGLAGVPTPVMPSARNNAQPSQPAAAFSNSITQKMNFNLIDDPKRLVEAINTPAGEEAFTIMLSRNPAKFRTVLGTD